MAQTRLSSPLDRRVWKQGACIAHGERQHRAQSFQASGSAERILFQTPRNCCSSIPDPGRFVPQSTKRQTEAAWEMAGPEGFVGRAELLPDISVAPAFSKKTSRDDAEHLSGQFRAAMALIVPLVPENV